MSKRKTRAEFAIWLEKYIEVHFNGNNAAAARDWDETRANVHAVLNCRIKPTEKVLKAVGYISKTTEHYFKGVK